MRKRKKIISDICPFYKNYGTCDQCNTELEIDDEPCYFECMATVIINNGYRKQSEGEWISVEERLPEDEDYVLVCTHKGSIFKSRYDHDWDLWSGFSSLKITHWMPLPEPPKGE